MDDKADRFDDLIRRHERELRDAFLVFPYNREDLYQEALIHLWLKFDLYDASRSFVHWAKPVMLNKARDLCDKWRPIVTPFPYSDLDFAHYTPRPSGRTEEYRTRLEQAYSDGALTTEELLLLARRYGGGMTSNQLAQLDGSAPDQIRKRLERIKRKVRRHVDDDI